VASARQRRGGAQEREDFDALVAWFRRRYPTAGERLAAIRRRMQVPRQR